MRDPVTFIVYGEPASKANSRKLVVFGSRPAFIKSDKARDYARTALLQIPRIDPLFEGEVVVDIEVYYRTQRPDLDESLLLDLMQERVYRNDRQVRERHVYHHIDADNPRAVVTVRTRPGRDAVEGGSAASHSGRRSRTPAGTARRRKVVADQPL